MVEIKRHGSYLEIDKNGFVVPIVSRSLVQTKWEPIIDDITRFYQSKFGNNLHSVYVRGSVAKGDAVENLSDFDSFCVLNSDPGEVDSPFSDKFQKEINAKYPFCTFIEISYIEKYKIYKNFPPRKRSVWAELIKTQSICVYGKNLASEIDPFELKDMVGHSYYIEKELDRLPEIFEDEKNDPTELRDTCVWITRRIVRSGFDLVMEQEKKFTRDLFLCYESFSKYYPHKKEIMYKILNLSLNPTDDVTEINSVLNEITPWLIEEINQ